MPYQTPQDVRDDMQGQLEMIADEEGVVSPVETFAAIGDNALTLTYTNGKTFRVVVVAEEEEGGQEDRAKALLDLTRSYLTDGGEGQQPEQVLYHLFSDLLCYASNHSEDWSGALQQAYQDIHDRALTVHAEEPAVQVMDFHEYGGGLLPPGKYEVNIITSGQDNVVVTTKGNRSPQQIADMARDKWMAGDTVDLGTEEQEAERFVIKPIHEG